jgi:uncharacterized integral membrane protein
MADPPPMPESHRKIDVAPMEPAQVTPAPTAPAQMEPAQVTPASTAPAQMEPAQVTPAPTEPAQMEPAQVTPAPTEPGSVAPTQVAADTATPAQLAPNPVDIPTSGRTAPPDPIGRTRLSGTWVGVIIAALVLTLLLVFILQNTRSVKISYFTAVVRMPIGIALLLAAIGGVLFAGVIASMRIWQLRRRLNIQGNPAGRGRRTRRVTTRHKAV